MTLARRFATRLALHADTRDRHAIAAGFLAGSRRVLDVGGIEGWLSAFLPATRVVTANVEGPADVRLNGVELPFDDAAFDAAASLDVLEHLPREERGVHLAELIRVARDRVVVCCPFGSPSHVALERELASWFLEVTGTPHRFLEEHILYGLPTEPQLRALGTALGVPVAILFGGDFRDTYELFRLTVTARTNRDPVAAVRLLKRRMLSRPARSLSPKPSPYSNRAFLVAHPA